VVSATLGVAGDELDSDRARRLPPTRLVIDENRGERSAAVDNVRGKNS
jgi:hypothetical protein